MLYKTIYKRLLVCTFCFFIFQTIYAQELSVQIKPGLMNYGGDLQASTYTFNQANFSFGADVMYRIKKFSLRGGFNIGKVQGDDRSNTAYTTRNLSFASNIVDGNLALQYDVFSMDDKKFTPYVFAGVGLFHFNPYTTYDSQKIYLQPLGTEGQGLAIYPDRKMYSLTQFMIPLGIGVKYKLSDQFSIGFEFCSRFLFTDYLDDVSTTYPDENELFKAHGQTAVDLSFRGNEIDPNLPYPAGKGRGGSTHNDNYYTSSLTLIYTFPQGSGFAGSSNHVKGRRLNCPKRIPL